MKKELHLDNFSGPLPVLLELIQAKQLDITTVSLAQVADQFLEHLQAIEDRHPEELAAFLVVATKLLLLKSRALLPLLQPEPDEDPGSLALQLKMYQRYAQATETVEGLLLAGRRLFARRPTKPQRMAEFVSPHLQTGELYDLFVHVLRRLAPVVRIPKAVLSKTISLREKITQLQTILAQAEKIQFRQLLADVSDRGEVVVTFLAVLELVRQQSITVYQSQIGEEIIVEKLS